MDYIEKIISYLKCEHEIIKNAESASAITKKYVDLLTRGKAEGFTPIIIVPSNRLCETINFYENEHKGLGNEAEIVNAAELLSELIKEAMPIEGDSDYDIMGEFTDYEAVNDFVSLIDYNTRLPYETILIAKIPTTNPWELAESIPMGGWNECPTPAEQSAVFKYWYEKYGALPAVVHSDIWEMYVENPPHTKDEAVALALEQFGFCSDIVWQGVAKVNALASVLIDSHTWYFWWD